MIFINLTIITRIVRTDLLIFSTKLGSAIMREVKATACFKKNSDLDVLTHSTLKNRYVEVHSHEFYEMVFIHKGSGIHKINEQAYTMLAGDFYMMSPADHHEFSTDNDIKLTNILFKKSLFSKQEWLSLEKLPALHFITNDTNGPHKIALSIHHKDLVEGYLKTLSLEFENQDNGWELASKANLISCLVVINRAFLHYGKQVKGQDFKNLPIRDTLQYIFINFKQPLNATILAKRVHLSTVYFSELFKKETGLSLNQYLNKIRVDKARVLIEGNTLNISEIAQAVGIDDNNYFSRIFKKHCGITPSEFKKITPTH